MIKLILVVLLVLPHAPAARALDLIAPTVPASGAQLMPEKAESFAEGLWMICKAALGAIRPDIREAAQVCRKLVAVVVLCAVVNSVQKGMPMAVDLVGTVIMGTILLESTGALIHLGLETVTEIGEYGKLLLMVLCAALSAQGGTATSAALYGGTIFFNSLLSNLISRVLAPMLAGLLLLSIAHCALGEDILKKAKKMVKGLICWGLKLTLYGFTGYMTVTGVVSGSTDALALKAAKLTISGAVPVVGGILSDASEAVLVSAGLVKHTAGVYGMWAILSVCLSPFLRIAVHYLMLKLTEAVGSVLGSKGLSELLGDFSGVMGLLLAMTGSECALFLISVVCFLRGMG